MKKINSYEDALNALKKERPNPCRRRVGLHPDQRHLDHGRPDLP